MPTALAQLGRSTVGPIARANTLGKSREPCQNLRIVVLRARERRPRARGSGGRKAGFRPKMVKIGCGSSIFHLRTEEVEDSGERSGLERPQHPELLDAMAASAAGALPHPFHASNMQCCATLHRAMLNGAIRHCRLLRSPLLGSAPFCSAPPRGAVLHCAALHS